MSDDNKTVALRFIAAMGTCDRDEAIACLDPSAFTIAKGTGKFAGIRRYETMIGTIEALKFLLPTGLRPKILSVTAEGDRVAVEWEGDAVTQEGRPYCNQYAMVFFLREGRIVQVNEYFCNVLADDVLWGLVASMSDQIPTG
jgi:ketosteroid isomerase-like protein